MEPRCESPTHASCLSIFSDFGGAQAPGRALGVLSSLVQREANTLAYIDAFWLTAWFAIAGLVLVALIGPSPKGH